jgi:hypothetical protein
MRRNKPIISQGDKQYSPLEDSSLHPSNFPLGSAESRAAARVILSRKLVVTVDFGTLPISSEFLPSYQELLQGWKDEGDRFTHEQIIGSTLFRYSILKDSDEFKRIKENAVE